MCQRCVTLRASYMLRMMPKQSVKSGAYEKWKQILAYHVANPQPRCDFNVMFESCSEACCGLLSDMLQIDERKRATAAHCFRWCLLGLSSFCLPEIRNLQAAGTRSSSPAPLFSECLT